MNQQTNPVRKGSIPMVMIVIVCLGIVAGAAIFSTGNSARSDKKSELNQAAWIVAQAAVEETIIKCSNGTAAPLDGKRQTFPADVTALTIASPGAKIEPVELVARTIEDAGATPDTQAERAIKQLAALVPGFWKNDNPGGATYLQAGLGTPPILAKGTGVEVSYDIEWRKKMLTAAAGTFDPLLLKSLDTAYNLKDGTIVKGLDFNKASLTEGKASQYYADGIENGGQAESDNNNNPAHPKVLALFKLVPSLPYLGPFAAGVDTSTTPMHDTGTLDAFKKTYLDATGALADHMQSRINGCNGDFNYAIGGMLSGLGRGTPGQNDQDVEENFRKQSQASGLTAYKEGLLTISTKVNFASGSMSADQSYTAHRIMRQMNLNTIMVGVGQSMIGYLHGYYNLTRADMVYLGFMGKVDPIEAAKPTFQPTAQADMFGVMNERYNVYAGNTQVRNAQLANCLGAPK